MKKIKYYYNKEACRYESVRVRRSDVWLNISGLMAMAFVIAVAMVVTYNTYFDSRRERQLMKENRELTSHHEILQKELKEVESVISTLFERDNNIYRKIYEAEPLSAAIIPIGHGGELENRMVLDKGLNDRALVRETKQHIDNLKQKAAGLNRSFDEIMELAKSRKNFLEAIPAIQPLHNPHLSKLVSGFGNRINPFHKARAMHPGVDYAAPRGEKLYATGSGTVKHVKTDSYLETGYGNYIEIDHGFGYVTKYAHLGHVAVSVGDQVSRGQVIGKVGSSGGSAAPHLHYEIIKEGKKIDPINYMLNGLSDDDYLKLETLASRENQSFD